jgi:uncharacterized membrane protein HdeD (DUF308 family)
MTTLTMSYLFLALYLIVVGLTILFGLTLPAWIAGLLALIAGILMLLARLGMRIERRPDKTVE